MTSDCQISQKRAVPKPHSDLLHPQFVSSPLIQPDCNISLDPCSQMNLGFEVQLDADHEGSSLVLAIVVNSAAKELTCLQER